MAAGFVLCQAAAAFCLLQNVFIKEEFCSKSCVLRVKKEVTETKTPFQTNLREIWNKKEINGKSCYFLGKRTIS